MPRSKAIDPVRDEVREFVHKSEKALAEASERWTETLREFVPGDGARVRKVVDDAFDFTDRILKNQREFANSVLDALLGEAPPKRPAAAKRPSTAKRAPATRRNTKGPRAKTTAA